MNSIYINHIPRTGGTTLSRMLYSSGIGNLNLNVFTPQISAYQKKEFNEQNIINSNLIMGHYGIAPNIFNPNIKTIAFLRDPVNQVVSMFSKLYLESQNPLNQSIDFDIMRSSINKNNEVELFIEWLFDDRSNMYTNNGQIYNLINTKYPYTYDQVTKNKTSNETTNIVNDKNAAEAISSLIFLGTTENIYKGYEKIIDLINEEFNVKLFKKYRKGTDNSIPYTQNILKSLGKSEIDYIKSSSSIDYMHWENAL